MKIKETLVSLILVGGAMTIGSQAIAEDFSSIKNSSPLNASSQLWQTNNPGVNNFNGYGQFTQLGLSRYTQDGIPYKIQNVQVSSSDVCEYINMAISAFGSGDFQKAKMILDVVVELDPNTSYAYVLRGLSFLMLESPKSALTNLEKGVSLLIREDDSESQYLAEMVNNLIPMVKVLYSL